MALYQLDRSDLNSLLIADSVDPSTRKAVIDLLQDDGYFKGNGSVQVQDGGALDPNTQVLIVDTPNATVTADPALKVIVDLAPNLTVTGATDLYIATPDGSSALPGHGEHNAFGLVDDKDENHGQGALGHDTVSGGSHNSNNLSLLNASNDTVSSANDTVDGGANHQQVLYDVGSNGPPVPTEHGGTTIHFGGDQTTTTSSVDQLVFTDQHVKH